MVAYLYFEVQNGSRRHDKNKFFSGYLARARARARARPSRAGGPPARIRRKCLKIRRWRAREFFGGAAAEGGAALEGLFLGKFFCQLIAGGPPLFPCFFESFLKSFKMFLNVLTLSLASVRFVPGLLQF